MLAVGRADGALAGLLAPRVGASRIDLMLLVVRCVGGTVEHIVGGEMNERHVRLRRFMGERRSAVAVDLKGAISLALRFVDRDVGRGIDDDRRRVPGDRGSDGIGIANIGVAMGQCHHVVSAPRGRFDQMEPDLAAGAKDHDPRHHGAELPYSAGAA